MRLIFSESTLKNFGFEKKIDTFNENISKNALYVIELEHWEIINKYICISHAWGVKNNIKEVNVEEVKGINWKIPISSKSKLDQILELCR